jgi:hypothetical protein
MNPKIYVAGHNGMVGSALVRRLEKKKIYPIVKNKKELDLTNQSAVLNFFKKQKINQVYVAAAKVGGIYANSTYPAEFIYENLIIEANIIHAAFLSNDIIKNQFEYIGFNSETPIPAQYKTSAAIVQWILENKWKLAPTDKDMVVMMHEIEYELDAKKYLVQSSLVQKGKNATETAMATTVGLPLAMGVCAYLKGEIKITGLHIPIHPSIYKPILKSLEEEGIVFEEITTEIK